MRYYLIIALCVSVGAYMKWTPPTNFTEVQIAMEEMYKELKKTVVPAKTEAKTIPSGYKSVYKDTFGDLVDENDDTVNIPEDTTIYKTKSQYAVPSSYFLDLRGYNLTNTTRQFTADYLALHDRSTPWKIMGVYDIDVTNNVSVAGPIANGRDQSGAFSSDSHVYFYVYWDEQLNQVASLSSASSTNPTLPSNSVFFMRIGSSYWTSWLWAEGQIGDKIWQPYELMTDNAPGSTDTWVEIGTGNVARAIPPTAKTAFGIFGTSTNPVSVRGMGIASNSDGDNYFQNTMQASTIIYGPSNATYYDIPITESQHIYWKASANSNLFYARNLGFTDDL